MTRAIVFPSLPSGTVLFCDDIREEVSGKVTYVGVYGSKLLIGEIPGTLAKLHFSVTLRDSVEVDSDITVKVLFEGSEDIENLPPLSQTDFDVGDVLCEVVLKGKVKKKSKVEQGDAFRMKEGRLNFSISPFHVPSPGRLKVRAYRDEIEIRIGAISIERMSGN